MALSFVSLVTGVTLGRREGSAMFSDRILVRNLRLRCVIGVQEWERRVQQEVLLNLVLHVSTAVAGASDAIADTVDYKALAKRIIGEVEHSSFQLVEALAERIAALCLADGRVAEVEVAVEKPGALRFAESVGVAIRRGR